MLFRSTLSIILLFTCASALWGRVSLTTETAGPYALRHNPGIAAARLRIEEARGRLEQSGRLSNPEVGGEFDQNVRTAERSGEISFMQRFPITARLRLEKAVSRAELAQAEAEVRNDERKLVASVRTVVVKLLANDAQRALRESELQTSREVAEFTRKRVETGEASVADATQVELEARILETELLQLSAERTVQVGELRPLLGLAPGEDLQVKGELSPPGKVAGTSVAVETRPDMQAARANIDAARSAAELARAQKWEDIGVGIAVQSEYAEDAPEGFMRDEFVGLRFSLPLPLWNQNSGRIREAEAAAARRRKEADALALTIRSEADAARAEMATIAKLVRTIDENVLPQASEIESHLRNANAAGQTTVVEVLRARSRRLLLQRQRLDAVRDYHLARVRYESAISPGPRPAQRGGRTGK